MIIITCSTRLEYLTYINGILGLTPTQLKHLSCILDIVLDTPIEVSAEGVVYANAIDLKIHGLAIQQALNMNRQVLANFLSLLRKKAIIDKHNKLNQSLLPIGGYYSIQFNYVQAV
jgi:hypothetical protein